MDWLSWISFNLGNLSEVRVQVWEYKGYDIACPSGGNGEYNFFAMKDDLHDFIIKDPVIVGDWAFFKGSVWSDIGVDRKTSAGYSFYRGEQLVYYGRYDGYLLFYTLSDKDPHGFVPGLEYRSIYITFRLMANMGALFTVNYSGSGRIIEMK